MENGFCKLDQKYYIHPRIAMARLDVVGLHAKCISYCKDNQTDGRIPYAIMFMLAHESPVTSGASRVSHGDVTRDTSEVTRDQCVTKTTQTQPPHTWSADGAIGGIVKSGLVEVCDGDFLLPDYLKWNTSSSDLAQSRNKWKERQIRHRQKTSRVSHGDVTRDTSVTGEKSPVTNEVSRVSHVPLEGREKSVEKLPSVGSPLVTPGATSSPPPGWQPGSSAMSDDERRAETARVFEAQRRANEVMSDGWEDDEPEPTAREIINRWNKMVWHVRKVTGRDRLAPSPLEDPECLEFYRLLKSQGLFFSDWWLIAEYFSDPKNILRYHWVEDKPSDPSWNPNKLRAENGLDAKRLCRQIREWLKTRPLPPEDSESQQKALQSPQTNGKHPA